MSEQAELLPCPFCGGEAEMSEFPNPLIKEWRRISCVKCNLEMGHDYATEAEIVDNWNRRAPTATMSLSVYRELMDGLDELEAAVKCEATATRTWILGHRVRA